MLYIRDSCLSHSYFKFQFEHPQNTLHFQYKDNDDGPSHLLLHFHLSVGSWRETIRSYNFPSSSLFRFSPLYGIHTIIWLQ